jgi:hypothetical protein
VDVVSSELSISGEEASGRPAYVFV